MSSLIAMVLKWTGLSQGMMELIAIGVVALGSGGTVLYWHHQVYASCLAAQQAADAKSSAKVQAAADAQTAQLQKRATTAESNYAKTKAAIDALALNPVQPVRLCIGPNPIRSGLPQAGSANAGNAPAGASSAGLQQLPEGNSGGGPGAAGPDIGPMLAALAASADQVGATLTEFQSR